MRPLLLFPLALLASACVIHTGDTQPANYSSGGGGTDRDYALANFSKIDSSAGVTVILRQGPHAVHARAENGDLSKLKLEVHGDTLVAGRHNTAFDWGWGNRTRYIITVTAPNYDGVSASSGSSIDGAALQLRNLRVGVSSGADVDLSGSCTDLRVEVSSGSDFDGSNLRCETASVGASSGADADAFATRSATGDASSGADITFHGRPAALSKDTSSGGSVRAL